MAKGRKLRFLGNGHAQDSNLNDSLELREEDVWSMIDNSANGDDLGSENLGNISVRARRRTARDDRLTFQDSGRTTSSARNIVRQFHGHENVTTPPARHVTASAPVDVPDWSKIFRPDSVESLPEMDDGAGDDNSEMVPPHEYLARAYARSRNSAATSVFEGVGRTLKGRDMRRVRDAVWSQTGFNG